MFNLLAGVVPYKEEDITVYNTLRWWAGLTLGDILDRAADIHPEKEGFADQYTRLTFEEARKTTNRLAMGLLGIGIKPLDRVLVQLPNWNEFIIVLLAAALAGVVPAALIPWEAHSRWKRKAPGPGGGRGLRKPASVVYSVCATADPPG